MYQAGMMLLSDCQADTHALRTAKPCPVRQAEQCCQKTGELAKGVEMRVLKPLTIYSQQPAALLLDMSWCTDGNQNLLPKLLSIIMEKAVSST